MRERALLLDAALTVRSRPGGGTTIAVRVPPPARELAASDDRARA
jgi:nitrate/nitrite-specific signal transduction histidine kinase